MKLIFKIGVFVLILALAFGLVACGSGTGGGTIDYTQDDTRPSFDTAKSLIIYFSQPDNVDDSTVVINGETLGNTQYMAYVIQENTSSNIFRIIPKVPYPTVHSELVDIASDEKERSARPEILDTIEGFEDYETVFVGYPNWWGDMPMILYTLFDEYDFAGKTIIPFNTHGGSGFSGTVSTIRRLESEATVLNGLSISRNSIQDAEEEIISWLKDLGFNE